MWLILLPLALDLFLWLGPRLSIENQVQQLVALLDQSPAPDPAFEQDLQAIQDLLTTYGREFNLLSRLSTAPLGLPSLMAARSPQTAPVGPPSVILISSPLAYLLAFASFSLVGLLLGAAYMGLIAFPLHGPPLSPQEWGLRLIENWARFLVLTLLVGLAGVLLGLPLFVLIAVLAQLAPDFARIAFLVGLVAILWLLIYVSFTLHGVVLAKQGVFAALWDSIRMVRWNLRSAAGLLGLMVALSWGLNYIWNLPGDDSWLLLLGVAGHAYIATALVTASFVFYQDRHRWWREAKAQLIAGIQQERKRVGEKKG